MNIGGHGRHCAPVGCSPSGRPGPKSAGCCRLTTSVGWTPALESPFGYSPLCSKGPRGRPREAARDGKFYGGGAISSNRRRRYHGRTAEASTLPSESSVVSPSSGNRTRARSPPCACRPPMQLAPPPQQRLPTSKERRASQPVGYAWRWANTPTTAATSRKACRPPAANIQSSAACQSTRTPFCFEDSHGDQRPVNINNLKIIYGKQKP